MRGLGTIINVVFILLGTTVGLLFKKAVSEKLQKTVIHAIGLSTIFIGISGVLSIMLSVKNGALQANGTMLLVLSLVIGAFVGESIDIERRLEGFGNFCRKRLKKQSTGNDRFVEGFVSSSLLFCVGAMAIIGSLEDGLHGNISTLFAKSVMDGTISVFFAATMGFGVYLSVLPVLLYQGAITLLAGALEPYLTETMINNVSVVGSVLVFAIGFNMLSEKKIRIGNLLPAVLVPVVYEILCNLLPQ